MAKTATIHTRIDEQVKNDAMQVLDALGISPTEAITLFFRQIALKNGIPFELTATTTPRSNLERVSEFKRDDLNKIIAVLPDSVDELWVFGSSITQYCRPDSDLDICIIGNHITKEDRKTLIHAARHAVDLIDVTHDEFASALADINSIYHEIYSKGLLIYKRGQGIING